MRDSVVNGVSPRFRATTPCSIHPDALEDALYQTMRRAATVVPNDVLAALDQSVARETAPTARLHILTSLQNFEVSARQDGLVCTDTGWPIFYVGLGDDVTIDGGWSQLQSLAETAVRRCTADAKLRPTMVHPVTRQPLDGNVGLGFPRVVVQTQAGLEGLRITAVPKGGGGDVFGAFFRMLLAADGMPGVFKFVLDCFRESTYAGKTCPPNIIGIGIGGTPELCMVLAKEAAVLRPVGRRHPDSDVAAMELKLLEAFNDMGVGPMGCGGVTAAIDVHIEIAATHPACTGVAFNAQCHIGRRAVARFTTEQELVWEEDPQWFQR